MKRRQISNRKLLFSFTAKSLSFFVLISFLILIHTTFLYNTTMAKMHQLEKKYLQQEAKKMFWHAYENYMENAFPYDELKPLSCEARKWHQKERGDLDDVLGGFSLTLIDSLDMLAIMGEKEEFIKAVQLVIKHVSFDRDVDVSVFESTIRVIGGLISAHMLASPSYVGIMGDEYKDELLHLAIDLGKRLLPAFNTPTGLPVHRINLKYGISSNAPTITCPAAAGSLLLEMSYLSRLSKIKDFEEKASIAVLALWLRRSNLNLLGSSIDVNSGEWLQSHVGIGAGLDSYFEYLLKYHVVSGNSVWLQMFNASYHAIETHMNHDDVHIEVDMHHGKNFIRSQRVSALQAFWPGLQVLAGDVSSAIRSHERLFSLWNKFGAMPELFDLSGGGNVIDWARSSPLRPELIESTYHLYQATRDHKYLKIGRKLLDDINRVSKVQCGYAAVGNIHTLDVEDRMDSYFLSETVKYLYLLFSDDPDIIVPSFKTSNQNNPSEANASQETRPVKSSQAIFSTEGHVMILDPTLFQRERRGSEKSQTHDCENTILNQKPIRINSVEQLEKLPVPFHLIGVSVRTHQQHITTVAAFPATFGHQIINKSVEAPALLYSRVIGSGCDNYDDKQKSNIQNKIVFVKRGECSFVQKTLRLQQLGAVAVIVINFKKDDSAMGDPTKSSYRYLISHHEDEKEMVAEISIPIVMISRGDAAKLHKQMKAQMESNEKDVELLISLSPWLL